jgi:hypothetical protein
MLPAVNFCGLDVTRLIIGANPFVGYSHQNPERDRVMQEYYTPERIKETWARAEAAGINTMITNNTNPRIMQAVKEYLQDGGRLQWIAQVYNKTDMLNDIQESIDIGCKAIYFHGALGDEAFRTKNVESLRAWCDFTRSRGVPVGVAGHAPEVHRWLNSFSIVDFHTVCFFNCGSLHDGQGDKFRLSDVAPAVEAIRAIRKPCIAYKIMGAGRIDARIAFEYAFSAIKPTDVVNVGMYRGDKDDMVEENAAIAREFLNCDNTTGDDSAGA